MSTNIKKDDTVQVLSGRDRGKKGRVLRVHPEKETAIVEQINLVTKHERPNPQRNIKGGILEKEAPIRLSNLAVVCGECRRPTRLRHERTHGDGGSRVVRQCARCGSAID